MCVARALHRQPNAGTTINTQILTEVSQYVESINGVTEGRWKGTLSFYKPMLKDFFSSFLQEEPKAEGILGCHFSLAIFRVRLKKGTISAVNSMPVKWVLRWQQNAGTTVNTQILTEVSQCVESINGVNKGKWKTTLNFYKPICTEQAHALEFPREFWGISLQEQPNKYYMVIREQQLVVEAESSMIEIMEKLQSYKTRVGLNFEGFQYQLGDFQLRVGKVASIDSESLRGIIMEMEYLPISSWETSRQIMGEFFDIWKEALGKRSLPGHFVHVEPKFSEYGLSDQYTSQHTAVQYATTIGQMVAAVQSSQAARN